MTQAVQLVPQTDPPSGAPNMNFAAPGPGRTNWGNLPYPPVWTGFAQPLDQQVGETPDPMRTMQMPQQEDYPDPGPPEQFYYGVHGRANDYLARTRVESETAAPWLSPKPDIGKYAADPKWTPAPEYRPTQRSTPSTWAFTRPFDQKFERRFNGNHFSMADHRRNYPIYGMEPQRQWRSTTIVQPPPWGGNLVDTAPQPNFQPNPTVPIYNVPIPDRGWVMK